MIDVATVTDLHHTTVDRWHRQEVDNPYKDFLQLVCEQHQQNYLLWHQEDIARSPDAGDAEIAGVKRKIDRLNQQRNDLIEILDDAVIRQLGTSGVRPKPNAQRNTETPGSAIDRLSIMSLRLFHMREQLERVDVDEEHLQSVREKLATCVEQHADLSESLAELLADLFAGRKLLKVYRQFKMYNDPTLNPYLYRTGHEPSSVEESGRTTR